MTAPTMTTEAAAYLDAVERELADLPTEERAELVEDLALHLRELEEEDDPRPLETRLGPASDYATELRVAAGLPARSKGASQQALIGWLKSAAARRSVRETRAFLVTLRPAWWVLRGYVVVLGLAFYAHGPSSDLGTRDLPIPAPLGSHYLGVLLVGAGVIASVRLAQARPGRRGARFWVAANAAVAVLSVYLAAAIYHRLEVVPFEGGAMAQQVQQPNLVSLYGPVTNIYAYTADGKPVTGVLLYDQNGQPLVADGSPDDWPDNCLRILSQPLAADGVPVLNSYPKQFVLDPAGRSIYGDPVVPGQCQPLPSPEVQLPVFPKQPR
jgi:hypothetical protein